MSQNGSTAALIAKAAAAAEKKQRQQQKSGVGRGSGRARERERGESVGGRQQESLSLDFICVQKISISPFCCASLCVSLLC